MTGQLGIDGQEQPERVCACRCGRSIEGKRPMARYASDACRARDWKLRTGYALNSRGNGGNGRTAGRKRSGLQVSYRKMVDVLEDLFTYHGADYPRNRAVNTVREALSDRQKALLAERKKAQRAQLAPTLTVAEQRQAFNEQEAAHA